MQYVGAGKVLFHATDETCRWRRRVGDVFFARYWVQTIRYLSRSKLAEGEPLGPADHRPPRVPRGRAGAAAGAIHRRAAGPGRGQRRDGRAGAPGPQDAARASCTASRARRGTVRGLLARCRRGPITPGSPRRRWRAGRRPSDFTVGPAARRIGPASRWTPPRCARPPKPTKGRYYTFADADRLLGDLPEGRQVPIEKLPPLPLWNRWPVLLVFLLLLIGEWLLRKRGGMV